MSVNDGSATSRQFVANPPFVLSKMMGKMIGYHPTRPRWTDYVWWGFTCAVGFGVPSFLVLLLKHPPAGWTPRSILTAIAIVIIIVSVYLSYLKVRPRKI